MTPAPALTEATMDKMTVEKVEHIRQYGYLNQEQLYALCDLAKIALTPPQDVAGLVEELAGWIADCTVSEVDGDAIEPVRKARDAILSLSARNRELEAENADMKISVIAFAGPFAAEHAKLWGLPKNHLFPTHYDILEKCGARMVDFVRADEAAIRALIPQEQGEKGK